ncbi:MAG: type II toxin-antitoxin system prevent-host-death family antitoxin [Defluviitaleaceae bacterium]|nr:type II toxin-antitoxin system prevent-host-death family antitoxin [Defluviitaleaceae bacterium]
MMITATEFKNNIGKYLTLVGQGDIFITKNGKHIAKLSSTAQDKVEIAKSLFGIIPDDAGDLEKIRGERLARYETTAIVD